MRGGYSMIRCGTRRVHGGTKVARGGMLSVLRSPVTNECEWWVIFQPRMRSCRSAQGCVLEVGSGRESCVQCAPESRGQLEEV